MTDLVSAAIALDHLDSSESVSRGVFRLRTTVYSTGDRVVLTKELRKRKRLSVGYDFLLEDARNMDAATVMDKIINLGDVKDGLYTVVPVNFTKDWETGIVDDYDYKLVPYKPDDKANART